jgi:hypothetical protein
MSDDEFVFGDDEDESLFGSSDATASDAERRFGTSDETDRSSTSRERLGGITRMTTMVVLAAVLVVAAGAIASPLVMEAFDAGSPTDERASSGGDGSAGTSTLATSTDQPVTRIVVTVEETTTERPKSTTGRTEGEPTATATPTALESPTTESPATQPTTERTTVPVNEFPAGEPADENESSDGGQSADGQSAA